MKILFLTEYFYPFAHGGSERSVLNLATSLLKDGYEINILTANFGTVGSEIWNHMSINRVPMLTSLSPRTPKGVSPIFFYNPLTQLLFLIYTLYILLRKRIDVVHVHGSFLVPPGYLAARIMSRKIIYTMRDYQLLCPLGLCINQDRGYKSCSIFYFLTKEIKDYIKLYTNGRDKFSIILLILVLVIARIRTLYYRYILSRLKHIVCISNKQKRILSRSGIHRTSVIYNTHQARGIAKKNKKYILFAGRLTPGKGIDLLVTAMTILYQKNKTTLPLMIAGGGILTRSLKNTIRKFQLAGSIKLLGPLSHEKLLALIRTAHLVVVPSRWEEPFGRIALEAQMELVPTVATNVGGLPEIITHNITGYICEPESFMLAKAILKAIKNNAKLRKNLLKLKSCYKNKFQLEPVIKYKRLYNRV